MVHQDPQQVKTKPHPVIIALDGAMRAGRWWRCASCLNWIPHDRVHGYSAFADPDTGDTRPYLVCKTCAPGPNTGTIPEEVRRRCYPYLIGVRHPEVQP